MVLGLTEKMAMYFKFYLLLLFALLYGVIINMPVQAQKSNSHLDIADLENIFQQRIKKYRLDNGIRVVLMKNGINPTMACYLKIGVGSADEPFQKAGAAHFLEHLLFKGTNKLGTTNFRKEKVYLNQIKAIGERLDNQERMLLNPLLRQKDKEKIQNKKEQDQQLLTKLDKLSSVFRISEEDSQAYSAAGEYGYNAYTSADLTNYQIQLPKNRLELWAWLESNRFLKPVFREFYTERKIIQEERKMRYDTKPSSLLLELFVKTAFGMSPYGKPVIGFASNIPRLKQSDVEAFFAEHYIPSRMVITIVGDIEFEPTLSTIKKYFSKIPTKETPQFPPIEFVPTPGRRTAILSADNSPYLITGWYRPSMYDKDDILFDIVSKLLTEGLSSRLVKRLVIQEELVQSIDSYSAFPGSKIDSIFPIIATPYKEQDYDKVQKIIQEELQLLAEKGPTKQELEKVKNQFYAEITSSLESNSGLAEALSYYEVLLDDYKVFFTYLRAVQQINPKDIQRVIRTYFIEDKNTTVWIKKK